MRGIHIKSLFATVLALTLAVCASAQPGYVPYIQPAGYPYSSICQIETGGSQGSGSLIAVHGNQALVLTCRHVAESVGTRVTCRWLWASDQVTTGTVVYVMPGTGYETDQALIVCDKPFNTIPIVVDTFDYSRGPWTSAGFRGGRMRAIRTDTVNYFDGLIKLQSPFIGGMSGGPTFDRYGRQVAVVVASDFQTMGLSTNGPRLRAMIRKFQREY